MQIVIAVLFIILKTVSYGRGFVGRKQQFERWARSRSSFLVGGAWTGGAAMQEMVVVYGVGVGVWLAVLPLLGGGGEGRWWWGSNIVRGMSLAARSITTLHAHETAPHEDGFVPCWGWRYVLLLSLTDQPLVEVFQKASPWCCLLSLLFNMGLLCW